MKQIILIFILKTLVLSNLYAFDRMGDHKGNGGLVVRCDKAGQSAYTTLDSYELRVRYQKEIKNIFNDSLPETTALRLLKQFSFIGSHEYYTIQDFIMKFYDDASFLKNIVLTPTEDTNHPFLEKGCELEQAIVQVSPILPQDPVYYISSEIWNVLSDRERGVLIFHEALYRFFNHHTDSQKTRRSVIIALSQELKGQPPYIIIPTIKTLGFDTYKHSGINLDINKMVKYHPNGNIDFAFPNMLNSFNLYNNYVMPKSFPVHFYDTGEPKKICFRGPLAYTTPEGKTFELASPHYQKCAHVQLWPNGKPKYGHLFSTRSDFYDAVYFNEDGTFHRQVKGRE